MADYTVPCKGIVAYSQHEWKWEELLTRDPFEDEFLVELIATGICHTDISGYGGIYPRVLGHEGNLTPDIAYLYTQLRTSPLYNLGPIQLTINRSRSYPEAWVQENRVEVRSG